MVSNDERASNRGLDMEHRVWQCLMGHEDRIGLLKREIKREREERLALQILIYPVTFASHRGVGAFPAAPATQLVDFDAMEETENKRDIYLSRC